jgi:hypothetical protein
MGKEEKNKIEGSPEGETEVKDTVAKSGKLYDLSNNKNRTITIKVGQEYLIFLPCSVNPEGKYKKGVPESIINHKDFESKKSLFAINKKGGK